MIKKKTRSRIAGFYNLSREERISKLLSSSGLNKEDMDALTGINGLDASRADYMIENVVGTHSLPLGIGLNFLINGRDVLIPMAIEEPSVVAGASNMAKLVRSGGGFTASADPPEMIGQIQIVDTPDLQKAQRALLNNKDVLLKETADVDPILKEIGGGSRDIEVRLIENSPIGPFLVLHLVYDVRDAMGANAVNTACERLAPLVESITRGRVNLRILSNLADRRLAQASCCVPLKQLAFDNYSAEAVCDGIISAWGFASADPYRAATHNKGIMNGVDSVVIATGNDWRSVEAGAHAYAARSGQYSSLSQWNIDGNGNLVGKLEMPLAVGIIGGATNVHPSARAAIKLMQVKSASELAEIIVSVGLAQNLAALRALATEGIQQGHMNLHARQVAVAAGAEAEMITRVTERLIAEDAVRIDRAEELINEWKKD